MRREHRRVSEALFFAVKSSSMIWKALFAIVFSILILAGGSEVEWVEAVEIGGRLEIGGRIYESLTDNLESNIFGHGEFELYLPRTATLEPRVVVQADLGSEGDRFRLKYLYLRRRYSNGHVTAGRQPISWSYGALFNPLDFGLGIEGLADRTLTPEIDGLRYQHFLGGGRNLQVVFSWPETAGTDFEQLGSGLRLRLPGQGYDLSFNLTRRSLAGGNLLRFGTTYSGDLGPVGTYGALGYFRLENEAEVDDFLVQLGLDYSWTAGQYGQHQVIFQGEYLRFVENELSFGHLAGLTAAQGNGGIPASPEIMMADDLLVLNISTRPDVFSSLGLALIGETADGNLALMPYYTTDLGGGLEFRLDGVLARDAGGEYTPAVSSGLTYHF